MTAHPTPTDGQPRARAASRGLNMLGPPAALRAWPWMANQVSG